MDFTPTYPYGWTADDVTARPIAAILEHTYGNCPCESPTVCLQNIAAIGEPIAEPEQEPEPPKKRVITGGGRCPHCGGPTTYTRQNDGRGCMKCELSGKKS